MPRSVQIYTWGLASAGLVMSCLALAFLPFPSLLPTLILAVAAATFERFTMTLPNRASFSLGSTFVLLAYGAHGPVAALLVELAAVAIAVVKAKRPVQKAFNFGQLLVSLTGMYLVTEALGGTGELLSVRTTVNLLIGGLAFFATNTCLISVVFALLQQRRYVWVFVEMVTESYVGIIGSLVLLPPFLYAFGVGGWPTLALLCGALLAFRYAVNLYLEQKRVHLEALGQLSTLLERKNGAQESHASRVAALARAAAEALKLSADDVDTIHTAAILHDIGEAELDARVVSVKVRRVIATLADAAEYRRHAELGEALVSKIGGLSAPARLIRHHHEAWDGSGYPDGLRGQAIPLGARILGAAEAIEESGAESIDDKLAVIEKLAGTVIDPALTCVLATAVRKVNKPTARAGAMMQEPEVSMLQGKVLESVRGSELLRTIGVGHLLMFHGDGFTDFIGEPAVPPVADEVQRMAEQAVRSQLPVRQHVVHGSKAFDVYCIPAGYESASVLVFDVTKALAVE
ncbi:MAG TPA: HD domain-containing phosphohydrolase, partial [Symbiobacteriaceae bacterium]|nr:HD domain-containing phosphohydrolase [Symbiobacteriaceae bacterium]